MTSRYWQNGPPPKFQRAQMSKHHHQCCCCCSSKCQRLPTNIATARQSVLCSAQLSTYSIGSTLSSSWCRSFSVLRWIIWWLWRQRWWWRWWWRCQWNAVWMETTTDQIAPPPRITHVLNRMCNNSSLFSEICFLNSLFWFLFLCFLFTYSVFSSSYPRAQSHV